MNGFSIITPCEINRLPLFINTIEAYNSFGIPVDVEFIIPTMTIETTDLIPSQIREKSTLIYYKDGGPYFNPARALNRGVMIAKYENIVITCPEVLPLTNVMQQFIESPSNNYVCQVFDLNQDGSIRLSLVNKHFRGETPGFYFLALYQKSAIRIINGWDERFCDGKAYEDEDFGKRWVRAGIPFEVREDILASHQWHPRNDVREGLEINRRIMEYHDQQNIYVAERGLNLYE